MSRAPLAAQVIRGAVVLRDSTTPVAGAIVVATPKRGAIVRASAHGRARRVHAAFARAPGGTTLKVLRIGYRPTPGPSVTVADGATETVRIVFAATRSSLSAMNVRERETCRVNADSGFMVARVWEEARKAMLTSATERRRRAARSPSGSSMTGTSTRRRASCDSSTYARRATRRRTHFAVARREVLDTAGYVVADNGATTISLPDAEVLLSPTLRGGDTASSSRTRRRTEPI